MNTGQTSFKSRVVSSPWLKPVFSGVNNLRCEAWDLIHGVDTCGAIPITTLDFESEHRLPGVEYQSHHPAVTRLDLSALSIRYNDYTFIDIGCGKGRVLLVAAEFPFRKIVGLEFAPALSQIAKRNLLSYRGAPRRCTNIEVVTGDALDYELGSEPQVLYFYSPFTPEILDRFVDKVDHSFQRLPRELLVMFTGSPRMRERAFGSRPQYQRLLQGRYVDIYKHR
jgi:SAM-dependent methyltransferase